MKKRNSVIGFYLDFIKGRDWWFVWMAIGFSIIWPLDLVISPYLSKLFVDRISDTSNILWPFVGIIIIKVLMRLEEYGYKFVWSSFISSMQKRIRSKLFYHIHGHAEEFFNKASSGSLARRVVDVAENAEDLFNFGFYALLPFVIGAISTIFLTTTLSPLFGLLFFSWFCLHFTLGWFMARKNMDRQYKQAFALSNLMGKITDSFNNSFVAKVFSARKRESVYLQKYNSLESLAKKAAIRHLANIEFALGSVEIIFSLCSLGLLIYLRSLGQVTAGDFIMIYGLYNNFSNNIYWISGKANRNIQNIGASKEALDVILTTHSIKDNDDAKPLQVYKGAISFKHITHNYSTFKVLDDFNLEIKAGETVGIVGFSGSGKSTIVKLLLRMFEPDNGSVEIDGQNISHVKQKSLRKAIAVVTQDTSLFNRSVKENIGYGQVATKEEVTRAAKMAHATEFIGNLEGKYGFKVGEKGSKLSGGQKQRIAIARAFLKDAPIVVLDEATSALDAKTEAMINKSAMQLMENRTGIVIAHRLSAVVNLDRIVVMAEGKVMEEGTHKDLLKKKGLYKAMWENQFK